MSNQSEHVVRMLDTDDAERTAWECSCGWSGSAATWKVDEASDRHIQAEGGARIDRHPGNSPTSPMPAAEMRDRMADQDGPIDWPARLRAAADAVDAAKLEELDGFNLRMAALWLESPNLPAHVVEAIGRALLLGGTS